MSWLAVCLRGNRLLDFGLAAVCLLLVSVAPALAQPEQVGNDTSPNGKYAISVTTADEEHYELKISNAATGEIASVFPMEDYDTETQHHAVDAVWRPKFGRKQTSKADQVAII